MRVCPSNPQNGLQNWDPEFGCSYVCNTNPGGNPSWANEKGFAAIRSERKRRAEQLFPLKS